MPSSRERARLVKGRSLPLTPCPLCAFAIILRCARKPALDWPQPCVSFPA